MAYQKKFQIQGTNDVGENVNIPVTQEGHMEVAIHSPRLPFGSIHTEFLRPEFQSDAVYGVNSVQNNYASTGSGSVTTVSSSFSISTGTTIYSQAYLQSRRRLRYRPGQGVVGRFTATFTTPSDNSYQVAGFGHDEDGIYFGYKDTDFGIIYNSRGVREVQTLTVTTGATANGNVTITLNGTAFNIAVTNASNIQRTVWEISQGTYTGWKAEPRGATVVFVADSSGNKAGAFSFSAGATGAAATIAETMAGVSATETFIAQSTWNGDKLDGTGASGVTIDPTKGNVFQIAIQYLGYGAITFQVEVCGTNQNNPDFVVVHTIKNPNTLTQTTFGNPSFPFTAAVYSAGSTDNLTVTIGSYAGFIEGNKLLHGLRTTYINSLTTVGATNLQALFTVMNTRYFGGRTNQSVINIRNVSGALKHTSPVTYYLIKNGTLAGNPNFSQHSSVSSTYWDTTATTVSYSTNNQLMWTGHVGDTGNVDHHFTNGNMEELTLQPGEWITLAAKASTGTPTYVNGSINTREDQ
jgi:hypothetical protein